MSKRAVSYLRISSASQIDNTSIEEQREKIMYYCKLNNIELVEEFKDEAQSAKSDDRENYKNMINFILDKNNNINYLLVYKSDRVHRSLKNLMIMIDLLQEHDINFTSITEQFDTSTAQGLLFLQMLGSFSEFERKLIAERTKSGRIANAKKEKSPGGKPPFGYSYQDKKLVKNDEEAEIIKKIFKLRNKEYSLAAIGKEVGMSKQRIAYILKNKIYTGNYTYNGKVEKNNISLEVEPIISKYMFTKASIIGRIK